jgi:hypothetical protein
MLIRKMEEFEQLSAEQKLAVIQRMILCPAMGVAIWLRPDMGARVISQNVGVAGLIMILFSIFLAPSLDKFLFFYGGWATALIGLCRRFQRWREHHKGIRTHSYYLGSSELSFRWLPRFIRKDRRFERNLEWMVIGVAGALLLPYAEYFGFALMIAGFCLGTIEHAVFFREYNERMDLVDGMVKSEIQTEDVDHFTDHAPGQAHRTFQSGAMPTGLGADIAHKIKRRR